MKLPVKDRYRTKEACLAEADSIIDDGLITEMTRMEIAREIYFHAKVLRFCQKTGMLPSVEEHADPIELRDGGDTFFRRIIYRLVWSLG